MTVALHVQQGTERFVKEDFQAVLFRIPDLIQALAQRRGPGGPDGFVRASPVQFRVSFNDVQECVHCPGSHDAVFAQLFIALRCEVRFQRFQVSARVPAVCFHNAEQGQGLFQGFPVSRQPVISGQSVNRKGLAVGVLGCV